MIEWLFFDLGSTLLDETDRVNERIEATSKRLQMDVSTFRIQLEQAAKTHPYVIKMDLPNGTEWADWPNRLDPLYPDAIPVLTELHKQYRLGVIANHGKDTAKLLGIDRFFGVYTASGAVGFGKPDLRLFEMALAQANCAPEKAMMIGDRLDNDIYPAKKLGMTTIWIRQGFGGITEPFSDEYEPDYTVNTLPEILDILEGITYEKTNTFNKSRAFIYRNARPLDIARFQYHFEDGSKSAVLTALSAYQNEDGGFGHALEADAWNPNSAPIQVWTATEILREIGFTDAKHPIIQGILKYLANGKDFEGHFWYNNVKSNNEYPHAPWWHTESDSTCHNDYNPTACLAGFIIRFADKDSALYQLGCRIVKEAYEQLMTGDRQNDMHTTSCYIQMMEYCKKASMDIIDLAALERKLREVVSTCIANNTVEWDNGYVCKPSQFINSVDSVFYKDNKQIADFECDYIVKTQLEDGSWNIPWSWNGYPEEWAISKNWWKGNGILVNMLYLKGMGRL